MQLWAAGLGGNLMVPVAVAILQDSLQPTLQQQQQQQ
jgi:hypothetical protein